MTDIGEIIGFVLYVGFTLQLPAPRTVIPREKPVIISFCFAQC